MASALVSSINSMLARLAGIKYNWPDNYDIANRSALFQHIAVWNNQLKREKEGKGYSFAKPAAFIEIQPIKWQQLNMGVNTCDLTIKLHIIDNQIDAKDGTLDQNLQVLSYRDLVMASLGNGFFPAFCGAMSSTGEAHDYDHDNVYHLVITMNCVLVDTKGADIDPDSGMLVVLPENSNVTPDISAQIVTEID
jgi:hypothetical protein